MMPLEIVLFDNERYFPFKETFTGLFSCQNKTDANLGMMKRFSFALLSNTPSRTSSLSSSLICSLLMFGRFASSTVSAPTASDVGTQVQRIIQQHVVRAVSTPTNQPSYLLVKDIARDIPDDVMERICEQHGGLSAFLRSNTSGVGAHEKRHLAADADGNLHIVKRGGMDALPLLRIGPVVLVPQAPASPPMRSSASASLVANMLSHKPAPIVEKDSLMHPRAWHRISDLTDGSAIPPSPDLIASVGNELLGLNPAPRLVHSENVLAYLELSKDYAPDVVKALRRLNPTCTVLTPSPPPADYDAFRLARFLSTETFTPLSSLRRAPGTLPSEITHDTDVNALHCWDVTQEDPLWIALHFPSMFLLDDADRPSALLFLLNEEYRSRHLSTTGSKYQAMTIEQLEEALAAGRKELKNHSYKFLKVRKAIKRAMQQKKWPLGSPFLNQDVLAYYVFDLLPEGQVVGLDDVRTKMIPASILERCGTFSDAETMWNVLRRRVYEISASVMSMSVGATIRIRRREQDEEADPTTMQLEDLQILALIHESLPKNFAGDRSISASFLGSRIGRVHSKQCRAWLAATSWTKYPTIFQRDPKFPSDLRLLINVAEMVRIIQELVG
ncbi:Hypothetical protein, putative [Bodo saltans]|uniref:Uncharacterized protein n=1 Tax=Bodo saltans TaxID=75058 RepID=A0A0S4JHG9_BODSA|nr:Hypothetical protein, putative [Bodo saltans]|eukprot:CUG89556.1 Hypothetical protein, putative [Bodo saltans]